MKTHLINLVCIFSLLLPQYLIAQTGSYPTGKKEIILDTALTNNCTKWEVKQKFNFSGVSKNKVGPFRIIELKKGESSDPQKSKSTGLFYKTIEETAIEERKLTILYNDHDSIFTDAIFRSTKSIESKTFLGSLVFRDDDYNNHSSDKRSFIWRDMFISLPGDTAKWVVKLCSRLICIGQDQTLFGIIVNNNDTIRMREVRSLKDTKAFQGRVTGVVFHQGNRQLAAMQFAKKNYLWLHASAEDLYVKVIGAFVATFFIFDTYQ